jgi:ring-1,2-phenylacetyl-CoA epoxidase subunit PaaE
MTKFHKVKIKKITRETPDCVSLTLDVPEALHDTFTYVPGQYLTFRRELNGEELRRSYSLCSSPLEGEWKVAIKRVPEGRFSSHALDGLKVGEELEVMPPMGKFVAELNPQHQKEYLMVAAGSGITPVISIIKTVLRTEPDSRVTLVYGNRGRNSIIFKEEIEGLKNQHLNRFRVYHILSREHGDTELFFGRIDKEKMNTLLSTVIDASGIDESFICGPEAMIKSVQQTLEAAGLDKKKIHFELFGTANPTAGKKQRPDGISEEDDKKSRVEVILDGNKLLLDMSYYGNTILDEAQEAGADLPYSCKGGMCSTCRARVMEGKVEMDVNYSLEENEVAAGYVLTCQARPLTEKVVVDFDQ